MKWITDWDEGSAEVLTFIDNFMTKAATEEEQECLRRTFRAGYCYYFAHMLKEAFGRGEVCWAAPFGHMVWVDDGIPYDVEGAYYGEAEFFIPEKYLGDAVLAFKHVPGKDYDATQECLDAIVEKYKSDTQSKGEKAIGF